jgi:hypothetical protein
VIKKMLGVALLLAFAASASAQQCFHFLGTATDAAGAPLASASVQVNTISGAAATIYSDACSTTTTNPLTAASDGTYGFYAVAGSYHVDSTLSGKTYRSILTSTYGSTAPFGLQLAGDLGNTTAVPQVKSTHLSAALPVAQGGTGVATLTAHGVVIGEGTSAAAITSAGTVGQCLISGGASADPAFGWQANGLAASIPATCSVGQTYLKTDTPAKCYCTATNTWKCATLS